VHTALRSRRGRSAPATDESAGQPDCCDTQPDPAQITGPAGTGGNPDFAELHQPVAGGLVDEFGVAQGARVEAHHRGDETGVDQDAPEDVDPSAVVGDVDGRRFPPFSGEPYLDAGIGEEVAIPVGPGSETCQHVDRAMARCVVEGSGASQTRPTAGVDEHENPSEDRGPHVERPAEPKSPHRHHQVAVESLHPLCDAEFIHL
jgi:hypothetical protein